MAEFMGRYSNIQKGLYMESREWYEDQYLG